MPQSAQPLVPQADVFFNVEAQPASGVVRLRLGDSVTAFKATLSAVQARDLASALASAAQALEDAVPAKPIANPMAGRDLFAANEPAAQPQAQPAMDEAALCVYCDGAAKGNPGAGGWGFVVMDELDRVLYEEFGGARHVTNNQMELQAMVQTLRWLDGRPAVVYTDSQYVQKGLTVWMKGWKRNNWMRGKGGQKEPVKNAGLWKELDLLMARSQARIQWVRGHNGNAGNERADQLANIGAMEHMKSA